MGNGAVVNSPGRSLTQKDFEVLEKLCRSQHFRENFEDYSKAFRKAIESDAIDMLEVLIPAGNAKRINPLHLACKLSKLESAEVLLSAGFSCVLQDEFGRTPLHACSLSKSLNSGLCATMITLSGFAGKKALTMRDRDGLTPLHLAAAQNNLNVIEALMTNGADISVTSARGLTAYQVASDNSNYEALQLLKDLVSNKAAEIHNANKKKSKSSKSNKLSVAATAGRPQTQAEFDRIMKVWERFFENAFKRIGLDPVEIEDGQEQVEGKEFFNDSPLASSRTVESSGKYYANSSSNGSNNNGKRGEGSGSRSSRSRRECRWNSNENAYQTEHRKLYENIDESSEDKWNVSVFHRDYQDHTDSKLDQYSSLSDNKVCWSTSGNPKKDGLSVADDSARLIDWFQWVVRYLDEGNGEGEYYVINKSTGETEWLDDYVARVARSTLLPCGDWDDYELHMAHPLPTVLPEALARGWLTYYNSTENTCSWLNIPTKSLEEYLPLGLGEEPGRLLDLNLQACESDSTWWRADHSCAYSWVLVVAPLDPQPGHYLSSDSEEEEVCYYYRNTITGETRWEPPEGWEELTQMWEGWVLCCDESAPLDLYWFDFESGESAWAET